MEENEIFVVQSCVTKGFDFLCVSEKKFQVIISAQYLKFLISISEKWTNSPKIDRLITHCFSSHSRIFHLDMNVTIASEFKPLIAAYGLWARRDLYRAIPVMTRDLGLMQRSALFSRLLRQARGTEDLF